jgi:hypothetical protein
MFADSEPKTKTGQQLFEAALELRIPGIPQRWVWLTGCEGETYAEEEEDDESE